MKSTPQRGKKAGNSKPTLWKTPTPKQIITLKRGLCLDLMGRSPWGIIVRMRTTVSPGQRMDNCFGLVLVVSGVLSHVLMKRLKPSLTCYSVYRRSWFTQIAVYSRSSPDGWFTTSLCLRRRSLWDRLVSHISYFIWHTILGLQSRPRVSDDKKRSVWGSNYHFEKKKIGENVKTLMSRMYNVHFSFNYKKMWWSVGAAMEHSQYNNLQSLLHQRNTKSRRSIFLFFFFFQLGKLNLYRSVNISTNLFLFCFVFFLSTDGITPLLSSKPHTTHNFCSLWRRANAGNFRLVIVLPWQFQPRQLVSVDHVFVFQFATDEAPQFLWKPNRSLLSVMNQITALFFF